MENKKVKLLVVSNMYPSEKYPHYGVFVENTVKVLRRAGYPVTVAAMKKADGKVRKLLSYAGFYLRVVFSGIFGRYGAIYAHYASHTALPLLIVKALRRTKLIMNVHGNDVVPETPEDTRFLPLTNRVLQKAQWVVCPSPYFREQVISRFAVPKEKIFVYPSGGVDTELFCKGSRALAAAQFSLPEQKRYVGFVSRIEASKGWDLFLRAGAGILGRHPEVCLIAVGSGAQENEFSRLADDLGIRDRLQTYPLLSQQALVQIFNLLDVFVFPTNRESESLGLVGLEAMACQTVTVLPDRFGPSGYGKDGENALCFRAGDAADLERVMEKALSCDAEALGQNARRTALAYSHSATDRLLLDFFRDILP